MQDLKCFIYIVGLLVACFFAIVTGDSLSLFELPATSVKNANIHCHVLEMGEAGPITKIPLSLIVYAYTALYLYLPIFFVDKGLSDLPILFLFTFLILIETVWLSFNRCFNGYSLFMACAIGAGIGIGWSYLIYNSNIEQLQYFAILGGGHTCKQPGGITFKCKSGVPSSNGNYNGNGNGNGNGSNALNSLQNDSRYYYIDKKTGKIPEMFATMEEAYYPKTSLLEPYDNMANDTSSNEIKVPLNDGDYVYCKNNGAADATDYNIFFNPGDHGKPQLKSFPNDIVAKSWDPEYKQLGKDNTINDCSHFPDYGMMRFNLADYEGRNISCIDVPSGFAVDASDPQSAGSTQMFATYYVKDGKLKQYPTQDIYNSYKGVVPPPNAQLQCTDVFTKQDYGEPMQMNPNPMSATNPIKYLTPPYDRLPENTSVTCVKGGKDMSLDTKRMTKEASSSVTGGAYYPTPVIYRVMADGSLTDYPGDIKACYSWNPNYDADPLVYEDCTPYTFNKKSLEMNTNLDNVVKKAIQFEGTLANYMATYSNLGWMDISGNMQLLQSKFDSLIMGRLMTGSWSPSDIDDFINNNLLKVIDDLNKKGDTGKHVASNLQHAVNNIFASIEWPDHPVNQPLCFADKPNIVIDDDMGDQNTPIHVRNFDKNKASQYWTYNPLTNQLINSGTGRCLFNLEEKHRKKNNKHESYDITNKIVTNDCDENEINQKWNILKDKTGYKLRNIGKTDKFITIENGKVNDTLIFVNKQKNDNFITKT